MRTVAAVLLALALAGCTQVWVRTGQIGDDVPGAAVQDTIDLQLGAALSAAKPGLNVHKAHCPEHLDLSNGKKGYCTLPVGGTALPIEVTSGKEYGQYSIKQTQALFVMPDVQQFLRADFEREYGVRATVRCGEPEIRVLQVGTRLRCAVAGPGVRADHVDLKVVDASGRLFIFRLSGMRSSMAAFRPYLSAHKARHRTVVPGSLVEKMIRDIWSGAQPRVHDVGLVGAATCPAKLDLTGTRRGRCTLAIAKRSLRYEASVDDINGITVRPFEAVIDTKVVRTNAVALYTSKLRTAGLAGRVSVDCGHDRVLLLAPASTFPCTLTVDASPRPMTVVVQDVESHVSFYVPPTH